MEMSEQASQGLKRKARQNIRKRKAPDEGEADQDPTAAIAAAAAAAAKRRGASKGGTTFGGRSAEDDSKLQTFKFESSNTVQQAGDQGATAILETETQHDRDARALREQKLRQTMEAGEDPSADNGSYKGMASYTDYRQGFRREATLAGEKGKGHGPLRGSVHTRATVLIDYKPDICKDYKETGFCGYGDACKFIHDRSDYKAGWELDREWEEQQKLKKLQALQKLDPDAPEAEAEEEDGGLPFACYICRKPWAELRDPVKTKCQPEPHYYCESCALKHNAKTGKCFVCEQPTGGIFNIATEIEKKVREQKVAEQT